MLACTNLHKMKYAFNRFTNIWSLDIGLNEFSMQMVWQRVKCTGTVIDENEKQCRQSILSAYTIERNLNDVKLSYCITNVSASTCNKETKK